MNPKRHLGRFRASGRKSRSEASYAQYARVSLARGSDGSQDLLTANWLSVSPTIISAGWVDGDGIAHFEPYQVGGTGPLGVKA
jgi:hypothetical protein